MKLLFLSIACLTNTVMAIELTNGIGINEDVKDALWDTSIPYAIARQGQRAVNVDQSVVAFIEEPDAIYSLSSNNILVQTAKNDRKVVGSWPLSSFADAELEPEIQKIYSENNAKSTSRTAENVSPRLGCLISIPLRYGDFTGDGNPELAVFAQDQFEAINLNVFSTALKKTIFSVRVASYDAKLNDRIKLAEGEAKMASSPLANNPTDGQYLSKIAEEESRMVMAIRPGQVGLTKIYVDDFDGDKATDILEWRKLYKTRELKDEVKGFALKRNTFIHYKLIDGEYKKQPTDQATVKKWLADKQLTWKKGYPSKSECTGQEGQEGQYIPEMHDPLLNDADVLL